MRENALKTDSEDISNTQNESIDYHLQQALSHLYSAVNQSIARIRQNNISQKDIGSKWENFLNHFFGYIREQGKENKINLLSIISFSRIRKW